MRRLGEPHDRLGGEGGLVAQSKPVVAGPCAIGIGQIGLAPVADVEEITECLDCEFRSKSPTDSEMMSPTYSD